MDIVLTPKDTTSASLKVTIAQSDYKNNVDSKLKELAKKADIKGFRPGKVPVGLMKKRHGKEVLFEEVNKLLNASINNYLRESDLMVVGELIPSADQADQADWENPTDFIFNFDLGHASKFDLKLDETVKVSKYDINVDKTTLEETVSNILEQNPKTINPDITEKGDTLFGHIKEVDGPLEIDNVGIPLEQVKDDATEQFVGLKEASEVTFVFSKTFDDEKAIKHVLGQEDYALHQDKAFLFTLKSISRQETAILEQDLYNRIFPNEEIETEEAFSENISKVLKENYDKEATNLLNAESMEALIEHNKFDLPEAFLKKWLKDTNKEEEVENIDKNWEQYLKQFRMSVISQSIGSIEAHQEQLKVADTEIVEVARQQLINQFVQYGITDPKMLGNIDNMVQNFLSSNEGENYRRISNELSNDKVVELVKSKIKVDTVALDSPKDFEEKVKAFNEKHGFNKEEEEVPTETT